MVLKYNYYLDFTTGTISISKVYNTKNSISSKKKKHLQLIRDYLDSKKILTIREKMQLGKILLEFVNSKELELFMENDFNKKVKNNSNSMSYLLGTLFKHVNKK